MFIHVLPSPFLDPNSGFIMDLQCARVITDAMAEEIKVGKKFQKIRNVRRLMFFVNTISVYFISDLLSPQINRKSSTCLRRIVHQTFACNI